MDKKPICVNVVALDKLIDYLLEKSDCDRCAKCVYYKEINLNEDYTTCEHESECKNGMIKYFERAV